MFGIVVLFRRESLTSKPSSQKKNTEEKKSEQAKTERSSLWESLTRLIESFLFVMSDWAFFPLKGNCPKMFVFHLVSLQVSKLACLFNLSRQHII